MELTWKSDSPGQEAAVRAVGMTQAKVAPPAQTQEGSPPRGVAFRGRGGPSRRMQAPQSHTRLAKLMRWQVTR